MMPAGSYYVGDLCYVLDDDEWTNLCILTIVNDTSVEGEFELIDGRRFAIYGTKWGDGEYYDQTGNSYSVDSGTIGCILWSDIKHSKYEDIESLGVLHEFDTEFSTRNNDTGVIEIGHIRIDTNPEYEENY